MHSMPMFQFSCARQNIKRFGGIMKHVQMLQLVACFLLLNFAQMADEMMLIMSLVLRHQFPRHQATLFMVEHRRRRRRRARRHSPYLWKLSRPNRSWFEIHYNDQTIPEAFFRRQLRIDRCTFDVLLNVLRLAITHENTKLRDCIAPEKVLALGLSVSSGARELLREHWAEFQCWKIECSRSSVRSCGGSSAATSAASLLV